MAQSSPSSAFLVVALLFICSHAFNPKYENAVYSVPYVRSFRSDLVSKSMGCGYNIAYSSYQHPTGVKDTLKIYSNLNSYGITFRGCQLKDVYAKVFGYSQDYSLLQRNEVEKVSSKIVNELRAFKNIIIDWKQKSGNLTEARQFLNGLISSLQKNSKEVYLKVPASYLCYQVNQKPYILGVFNARNIIVEMYGQSPYAYKNHFDIFQSQGDEETKASEFYPKSQCPQFPSYTLLKNNYPNINFFIEKTLQQEQPGFLGKQFDRILQNSAEIYQKKRVFFDAFPPNIIHV